MGRHGWYSAAAGAMPGLLLGLLLGPGARSCAAQEAVADQLRLRVAEVSRSIDLARDRAEYLTITVEIAGTDAGRLRRVQPLRDDFQVVAGKKELPCRWLRGGSLPEDPHRLRFTLGFSMPPASVRAVDFRANLPRLEGSDAREVRLTGLRPGDEPGHGGTEERIRVTAFREEPYAPPALPPAGTHFGKGGPIDTRVFRAGTGEKGAPERAVLLSFYTHDLDLYDPTLEVSGSLLVEGGPPAPLLSTLLQRDPARSVKSPPYPPFVTGHFYFAVPRQGRAVGVLLRFVRRPSAPPARKLLIRDLPVPGREAAAPR